MSMTSSGFLRLRLAIAALVVLCVGASCGDGDSSARASEELSLDDGSSPSLQLPPLPDDPTGFQEVILGDGVVDESEYERAVLTSVQCVLDGGAKIKDLKWIEGTDDRTLQFFTNDPDLYDECVRLYSQEVESAWAHQNAPSEADRNSRLEALGECLRSEGIDFVDWLTFSQHVVPTLDDAGYEILRACRREAGIIP
jgi:hypothetical protein